METQLEKWRGHDKALSPERRAMIAALERLQPLEIANPTSVPRPKGRLAFVLDLTMSRATSLRKARIATAGMFDRIKAIGSIAVKLIYFRGRECTSDRWEIDPELVSQAMQRLSCKGGATQIVRALGQVLDEKETVSAVVFIGDHCEDRPGAVRKIAEELRRGRIPVFVFHERDDRDDRWLEAKPLFQHLAEVSGGVYVEFNPDSPSVLHELLSSVAAFSAGGTKGLTQIEPAATTEAKQLQSRLLLLGAGQKSSNTK